MPESNAEKLRRLAVELTRIRNQLRELVSEQAGDLPPQAKVPAGQAAETPETTIRPAPAARMSMSTPQVVSQSGTSSGVSTPQAVPPAAAHSPAGVEDFSPDAARTEGDPLEEILKASPVRDNQNTEPEGDDIVVVDISPRKPPSARRKTTPDAAPAPGTTGNDAKLRGDADKDYPPKPPPRKRK